MKRYLPPILLAGDVLAIFMFIFLGQIDHETVNRANPILGALPQVFPFVLCWVAAAWLLGAYKLFQPFSLVTFLGRSLTAWLVAAPLGMVLRALLLGRATIPVPFFLVTLAVGGSFLLGWRVLAGLAVQRSQVSA